MFLYLDERKKYEKIIEELIKIERNLANTKIIEKTYSYKTISVISKFKIKL
jgi:hypothetical protein